jgi:deoxyribonuclease-1
MIIDNHNRVATPPVIARGKVARASLYMMNAYPERVKFSANEVKMFKNWNHRFPPDSEECYRGELIEALQGNANNVLNSACDKQSKPTK